MSSRKLITFCANVKGVWVNNITFFLFIVNIFVYSHQIFVIDEKEPIEMNAGACPNPKCSEYIDFDSIKMYPTKCKKCGEEITEKHYQHFKDIMNATRTHLDSLKMSNIACKI